MLGRRIARRCNPLPRGADDCGERYWQCMNRFTKALLVLAAIPLCVFTLWKVKYPTHAWNQKLTVTVSTPRGEVSGSSVVAVSWTKSFFREGALYQPGMRGDATTVDLGGGQFLFALLGYFHSEEPQGTGFIALKLLGDEKLYWSPDSFKRVQAARGRGPITLPQKLYPNFLRFRDIKDPVTAEVVDPDNLAKSFGRGVRLVRVTIEITDDAVKRGIENILPWLPQTQLAYFPQMRFGPDNLTDLDNLRSLRSKPSDSRK